MNNLTYRAIKRTFDVTASAALLGITAPLLAVISVLVKRETAGSAIYIHRRVGRDGEFIDVYKFRSMKVGSDEIESVLSDEDIEEYYQEYKLSSDPRVTEIGRRLRKSSLDELPQLFNVIKGNMSLVGPRPVTEKELEYYSEDERSRFLKAKPGITGYWQVNGRNTATYKSGRRQELELYYADNSSLCLDLLILLKTPAALFKGR